ncbi:MAG: preprotein translocase subunit SecG [Fibrobacter sp.]|jgi:preprotein translocase subunit SecG|nr:preprotein translocase subunit SecG [Fibrobacter sp.]
MPTLFWIGIVFHVFLCLFLILLVLIQNDKLGGLAGLGGMTSQSAFSTAGAATFIQKFTRWIAFAFFFVVLALGFITSKQVSTGSVSDLKKSAEESGSTSDTYLPAMPTGMPAATPIEGPANVENSSNLPLENQGQ